MYAYIYIYMYSFTIAIFIVWGHSLVSLLNFEENTGVVDDCVGDCVVGDSVGKCVVADSVEAMMEV